MILAATQDANPSGAPDPDLVTPGTIGFLVTLAIVIVVIFLIRDALKRVRRVRARSEADDAYPIPLRKYAVPNQSKLSGASAPVVETTEEADDVPAEADDETSQTAGSGQTADARKTGEVAAEADGATEADVLPKDEEHEPPKPGTPPLQD